MSKSISKVGICQGCKKECAATIHLQISGSGAETFTRICSGCNRKDPFRTGLFISKDEIKKHFTAEEIASMPVLMPDASVRCVRCGARGAELHHWGPKAYFGQTDAESWPKDYLCKPCHDRWHAVVTPNICEKAS